MSDADHEPNLHQEEDTTQDSTATLQSQ